MRKKGVSGIDSTGIRGISWAVATPVTGVPVSGSAFHSISEKCTLITKWRKAVEKQGVTIVTPVAGTQHVD
jgi:hypothetical protein